MAIKLLSYLISYRNRKQGEGQPETFTTVDSRINVNKATNALLNRPSPDNRTPHMIESNKDD